MFEKVSLKVLFGIDHPWGPKLAQGWTVNSLRLICLFSRSVQSVRRAVSLQSVE